MSNMTTNQSQPFDSETGHQLEQWIAELPSRSGGKGKGRYFKMEDGETLDVIFDVKAKGEDINQWITKLGLPKLNKRTNQMEQRDETKFNFSVWSSHSDEAQIWRASNTATADIFAMMREYNTNNFQVTRRGKDLDTRYYIKTVGVKALV